MNDNEAAIAFYERRGWSRSAIRRGAMIEARKLKPELPEFGQGGVPIRDAIDICIFVAIMFKRFLASWIGLENCPPRNNS